MIKGKKGWIGLLVVAVIAVSFFSGLFDGMDEETEPTSPDVELLPGNAQTAPDVAPQAMLDAILSRYAGEVVLVDLWATWCEPCKNAIRKLEPLKANRFKDVKFVYITDSTSPKEDWTSMIPGINGDHYYLNGAGVDVILEQLGSGGYPTYLIVDRNGKRSDVFIGYKGETMLRQLDAALK